jgi:hypothetical protein
MVAFVTTKPARHGHAPCVGSLAVDTIEGRNRLFL